MMPGYLSILHGQTVYIHGYETHSVEALLTMYLLCFISRYSFASRSIPLQHDMGEPLIPVSCQPCFVQNLLLVTGI